MGNILDIFFLIVKRYITNISYIWLHGSFYRTVSSAQKKNNRNYINSDTIRKKELVWRPAGKQLAGNVRKFCQ